MPRPPTREEQEYAAAYLAAAQIGGDARRSWCAVLNAVERLNLAMTIYFLRIGKLKGLGFQDEKTLPVLVFDNDVDVIYFLPEEAANDW